MGSAVSSENKDDRKRRQDLDDELTTMQNSLFVTATSHYLASAYYRSLDVKLQYVSFLTGAFGTTGGVLSKLAWQTILAKNPRVAPILAATSATSLLFTVVVNIPRVPNSPGTLQQLHFKSGIECQYLNWRNG